MSYSCFNQIKLCKKANTLRNYHKRTRFRYILKSLAYKSIVYFSRMPKAVWEALLCEMQSIVEDSWLKNEVGVIHTLYISNTRP